ncbi:hypothetical protein [uncultured Aquimarina sp.]|uniref:hypothetical protein n=1 Tax=uncultured Aquimarina sp. TaxID=575652 RepID=UPI002601B308|nr:hypothetical protein [uncultured Aquimarina sp.]
MHRSKNILVFFFCFYTIISVAQVKLDSIEQVLVQKKEYFDLQREIIHLHTNKTLYITDEAIWFKAYIVDNLDHKPFTVTKNLYVTLYNELGDKISHKLYLAKDGFADGAFSIPKNLDSGNYILMASTAHQDNFREDERYYQQITIQNLSQPTITEKTNELQKSYDVQILPEGGNLLAGIINTCGIKVIDQQGVGVQEVTSKLFSQNSKEPISEFKLNQFGMGKFSFNPSPNETYFITSTIGNTEIKTEIPKQQSRGVLIKSSFHPTKPVLVVELSTNQVTLPTIKNKKFHILIHQYQKTKGLSASFTKGTNVIKLAIPLKDLPYGVNTISLFDEKYNPISERLVFNDTPNKRITSERIKSTVKEDSIVTSFRLKSKDLIVDNASLSISVLPVETISNTNNQSIINSIYLQPFINSHVENPTYYFQNVTKRKKYNLDILLLTQGWSKYDWKTIFRKDTPAQFDHEQGITLKGSINKIMTPNTNLLITSQENQFTDILSPEKDKPLRYFVLNNLTLRDSTKIQFVINDKKNQTTDANVKANLVSFKPSNHNERAFKLASKAIKNYSSETSNNFNPDYHQQFFKSGEQLEKVVITAKASKRSGSYWATPYEAYIPEDMKKSKSVLNYLNLRRIRIARTSSSFGVKNSLPGIYDVAFQKRAFGETTSFAFYVNGAPAHPSMASAMNLEDVNNIYLYKSAIVVSWSPSLEKKKPLNSFIVTDGYQVKRSFYTPKYQSYDSLFFNQYGVLGWTPTIKRNTNNEYEFSFINTLAQEAKIFIEGVDQQGNLISEIKIIQIPKNP